MAEVNRKCNSERTCKLVQSTKIMRRGPRRVNRYSRAQRMEDRHETFRPGSVRPASLPRPPAKAGRCAREITPKDLPAPDTGFCPLHITSDQFNVSNAILSATSLARFANITLTHTTGPGNGDGSLYAPEHQITALRLGVTNRAGQAHGPNRLCIPIRAANRLVTVALQPIWKQNHCSFF